MAFAVAVGRRVCVPMGSSCLAHAAITGHAAQPLSFRLGPQFLAYLNVSDTIGRQPTGGAEQCRSPGADDNGGREGIALPRRLLAVGTFALGKRCPA